MNKWNPHNYLMHYGKKGMHWGERNYQNPDGTWTELGKERRRIGRQKAKSNYTVGRNSVDFQRYLNTRDSDKYAEARLKQQGQQAAKYDEEEMRIQRSTYSQPPSSTVQQVANQLGLKVKTRATSMMEDRAAVNPNFSGWDDGYSNNCMGCTLAYILRRKGLDVNAGSIPNGATVDMQRDWIEDFDKNLQTFDVKSAYYSEYNKNQQTGGHNKSMTDLLEDRIKREFSGSLNESHYGYLGISRPRGSGHAMAWEYDPKTQKIIFIESQDNSSNAALQIERIGTGQTDPDVEFIVDPKIRMSNFSQFATAGNGLTNRDFVNRNDYKLQIKNKDDPHSSFYQAYNMDRRIKEGESEDDVYDSKYTPEGKSELQYMSWKEKQKADREIDNRIYNVMWDKRASPSRDYSPYLDDEIDATSRTAGRVFKNEQKHRNGQLRRYFRGL